MDPPSTLPSLREHLATIISSQSPTQLDVPLVESFTAQLTDGNTPPLVPDLIPTISRALPKLESDPAPLTALLLRLLSRVSFTDILQFSTSSQLLTTLISPSPAVQQLGLSLLQKASVTPAEAGILASWPDVVKQILGLSLAARDTGVATKAATVLVALLNSDYIENGGAGVLWRRIFGDESVYRVIFELTSWKGVDIGGRREKTQAQSRLLSLLESLAALDWDLLSHSRFESVESAFYAKDAGRDGEYGGLILYATTKMVEEKEDVMMHMLLLEFYTNLLNVNQNRAWAFLDTLGLIRHTISLAVTPELYTTDFLDHGLLQSKASLFVARLCALFPEKLGTTTSNHKMLGQDLLGLIKTHLENPYAGPHAPSLAILRALPEAWIAGHGVIGLIPLAPPEPEFFRALVFLLRSEVLYREYLAANREMWEKVVKYASSPAHAEIAVAALELIDTVAAAGEWGLKEVLSAPGVVAMLVEVPESFLSSRAGADTEAMAWRVNRRRWEVAGAVMKRLPEGHPWKALLAERVGGGVFGKRGVGSEIATMGME